VSADDVVNLTITLNSSAPTRAGFGTPLIVTGKALASWGADLVRTYQKADDMLADGFVSSDIEYKHAVALKSQRPSVKQFKVGKLNFAPIQIIRLTPVAGNLTVYSGKIDGQAFTFTSDASGTVAEACAGLQAVINPLAGVTSTDNTTHVTVTTDTAGLVLQYTELTSSLVVTDMTVDPGDVAAAMNAIKVFDNDWYGLVLPFTAEVIVNEFAAWIETQKKILVCTCANGDLKTSSSTDLGSDLKGFDYFRTSLWYHQDVGSTLATALMGQRFTAVPGSDTWAHKSVVGVPVTKLSATEEGFLRGKNVNYYLEIFGNGNTLWGTVAGGDYVDIVRGIDHLYARIQEAVIGYFQANERVPYTNKGAQALRGVVQGVLDKQAAPPINFLTSESPNAPVCTVPDVNTVDAADKVARKLPDVEFSGKCTGAIHLVDIRGVVSV
jgi:uncharacterized protein DUF3383